MGPQRAAPTHGGFQNRQIKNTESSERLAFFGLCFWVIELNEEVCHPSKNGVLKMLHHRLHGFTLFLYHRYYPTEFLQKFLEIMLLLCLPIRSLSLLLEVILFV